MKSQPRITLITPSFNQAAFLTQTIESVLDQGYANLQYGVVDGGSTDGSAKIIERYRRHLDFAIIEPDRGQTDALNKGLRRADGELVGWLCSDDTLLPGALAHMADLAAHHPRRDWFAGACVVTDEAGGARSTIEPTADLTLRRVLLRTPGQSYQLPQPGVFWRRKLNDALGLLDESLHYTMDFEFWLRLLSRGYSPRTTTRPLATYRLHQQSKTCAMPYRFLHEHVAVEGRYARYLSLPDRWQLMRRIGYMKRAAATQNPDVRLGRAVLRRPWWILSQQVRAALITPCAAA